MAKLTAKQQRFVEEYLVDLNATQAAIRAGYSPNTANEQGSRLLANVSVRACIDIEMAERAKRTGINADRILIELARIGLIKPDKLIDFDEAMVKEDASEDDIAAIASIKVKKVPTEDGEIVEREIKMHDKIKALELCGKHLGMFKEKLEINANVNSTAKLDSILEQLGEDDE